MHTWIDDLRRDSFDALVERVVCQVFGSFN